MSKTCTKCGETKPLDEFYRHKGKADGVQSECKECKRERQRRYYEENRDKVLDYQRRYREENPEKVREYERRYYKRSRNTILERDRQRYWRNRDKELEKNRRYYVENREKELERGRRHREENRDYVRERAKRYAREKRNTLAAMAVNNGNPWTDTEDLFIMAENGMNVYQKASHLGRTYPSLMHRRRLLRERLQN